MYTENNQHHCWCTDKNICSRLLAYNVEDFVAVWRTEALHSAPQRAVINHVSWLLQPGRRRHIRQWRHIRPWRHSWRRIAELGLGCSERGGDFFGRGRTPPGARTFWAQVACGLLHARAVREYLDSLKCGEIWWSLKSRFGTQSRLLSNYMYYFHFFRGLSRGEMWFR